MVYMAEAYNFAQKQHVLAPHEKKTTVDVGIQVLRKQALHCVLKNQVS